MIFRGRTLGYLVVPTGGPAATEANVGERVGILGGPSSKFVLIQLHRYEGVSIAWVVDLPHRVISQRALVMKSFKELGHEVEAVAQFLFEVLTSGHHIEIGRKAWANVLRNS